MKMITYKVDMYLGLSGGLIKLDKGILHSTTIIESDRELTKEQVEDKYYSKIGSYPKTHHLEITKI